jgi:DNA phosphorothioation-dependent restriction protein DptF
MHFRQLRDTLSRASAQVVRTLGNRQSASSGVTEYLYVETPIEHDFHQALEHSTAPASILFLCGSRGDGKSAILTRYYERYNGRFLFNLDATPFGQIIRPQCPTAQPTHAPRQTTPGDPSAVRAQ